MQKHIATMARGYGRICALEARLDKLEARPMSLGATEEDESAVQPIADGPPKECVVGFDEPASGVAGHRYK